MSETNVIDTTRSKNRNIMNFKHVEVGGRSRKKRRNAVSRRMASTSANKTKLFSPRFLRPEKSVDTSFNNYSNKRNSSISQINRYQTCFNIIASRVAGNFVAYSGPCDSISKCVTKLARC
ncbi:hypothetical protein PUN28_012851 [Cardiocondyla obscurior]|uniref:Uncharacterized protein n=1 Tax=Cardiocondyla obscurior TaxID=286306 RepID=A0AAW2F6Y9_9HYME